MPGVRLHRVIPFLLGLCLYLPGITVPVGAQSGNPPPVDQVFALTANRAAEGGLQLDWRIAPGNYLYRDKIIVKTAAGDAVAVTLPPGQIKDDPTFGSTEVYHDSVAADVAMADLPASGHAVITYQGCAERGICYPPVRKSIDLVTMIVTNGAAAAPLRDIQTAAPQTDETREYLVPPSAGDPGLQGEVSSTTRLLSGHILAMLAAFFGFGLLLSFTPCIFPMIPILSGMLARSGENLSARRGFTLSGAYVLAMALAYAALGIAAAWSGQNLQIVLQTPIALGVISLVFVALALSMFGFYDLQLPARWADRLSGSVSGTGGSIGGAALLGFGSALIVGPCVTPPLAAALLYVAQTGDLARGAAALFALGLGMGMPLLAFGTFGAGLLPKSGPWLVRIKHVFGFVFIAMAVWMLSRVTPEWLTLALWGAWLIGLGLYCGAGSIVSKRFWRSCRVGLEIPGAIALACGVLFLVGSVAGNNVLRALPPFASLTYNEEVAGSDVHIVTSPAAFDAAMATARAAGKSVLLDFSADWCIECKAIDRNIFGNKTVQQHLRDVVLIRADVTNYNDASRALMQRFDVVGPPTMIFFDAEAGKEIPQTRTVGPIDADTFIHRLASARRS
ncbi:MAG: protein-disulfide reductase DsbD [Afipia sp.]